MSVMGDERRLTVGDSVPTGVLYAEEGNAFNMPADLGEEPSVLIFYRGGWCPYCTRHLSALLDIEKDLIDAGFQLFAISPDRPEVLRGMESVDEVSYKLLSDSSMEVSRKFGIAFKVEDELVEKYKNSYGIDIEGDSGQTHHLLPHPSVFIIDAKGIIQFAYVNEDYKVRLEPDKILAAARQLEDQ
jgi:peroxiredoxin